MLALLRSDDDKLKKKAQSYIDLGLRTTGANLLVFTHLNLFSGVNDGTIHLNDHRHLSKPTEPVGQLLVYLINDWLGNPRDLLQELSLAELGMKAEAAGFHFIAVQAAELLRSATSPQTKPSYLEFLDRAAPLRQKLGLKPLRDWFERQEPWQRQLAALAKLSTTGDAAEAAGAAQSRRRRFCTHVSKSARARQLGPAAVPWPSSACLKMPTRWTI